MKCSERREKGRGKREGEKREEEKRGDENVRRGKVR